MKQILVSFGRIAPLALVIGMVAATCTSKSPPRPDDGDGEGGAGDEGGASGGHQGHGRGGAGAAMAGRGGQPGNPDAGHAHGGAGGTMGGGGAIPPETFEQDDPAYVPKESAFDRIKLAAPLGRVMMIDVAPDETAFIAERDGLIKAWKPDGTVTTAGRLDVFTGNEDGLLGLALDPGFAGNGFMYVTYSPKAVAEQRVSRFKVASGALEAGSEKVLLRVPDDRDECCHAGGGMAFDGMGNLYVSFGDNTHPFSSDGYTPIDDRPGKRIADAQRTSANTMDLRGKILRIKPEADGTYSVPAGNLFSDGSGRPEIYVMGARNPFRIAVDRARGWLYWGDVGPDACATCDRLAARGPRGYDEFNQTKTAGNYGWPYCIADNKPYVAFDFDSGQSGGTFKCDALVNQSRNNTGAKQLPAARPAWLFYDYGAGALGGGGRTAIAGAVYRWAMGGVRAKLPRAYDGSVFLMEYTRKWIMRVETDAAGAVKKMEPFLPAQKWGDLITMAISPSGVMYVGEYSEKGGAVYRVEFAGANRAPVVKAAADVSDGPVPLTVAFSSAGTRDPENQALTYAWDFDGDGKVDSSERNPTFTYRTPGLFAVRLAASDGTNTATGTLEIAAGNTRPEVKFVAPPAGAFVAPGEVVSYSVAVTDREDGATPDRIPCAQVQVTPALGHDVHQHDGTPVAGCSGSLPTADGIIASENSWQLLDATFTDAGPPPAPRLSRKASVLLHFKRLEAEHFDFRGASNDVRTEPTTDPTGGDLNLAYINHGSWVCWNEMNFTGITGVRFRVASAGLGGRIEVHRGSPTGATIGRVDVPVTGGWQSWTNVTATLDGGTTTDKTCFVFLRNAGDKQLFNLNYLEFQGAGVSRKP